MNKIIVKELAFFFLVKLGYKILLRDYECAVGAIDLISKRDGVLVFTEVLTNKEKPSGTMEAATRYYLKRYGITSGVNTCFETVRVTIKKDTEPVFKIARGMAVVL